jgi:hypothetical protein
MPYREIVNRRWLAMLREEHERPARHGTRVDLPGSLLSPLEVVAVLERRECGVAPPGVVTQRSGADPVTARSAISSPLQEALELKIVPTGASGVIRPALIGVLTAERHQLTGTTRNRHRAGLIRSLGAKPALVDAFDCDSLDPRGGAV